MKTAYEIWRDLEARYSENNVPKSFQLRSEISHLAQGNMSISS